MYILLKIFGVGKIFFCLFGAPRLQLFDQKYSKNSILCKKYYSLK